MIERNCCHSSLINQNAFIQIKSNSKIAIYINDIHIVDEGKAIAFNTQSVVSALGDEDVNITVDLQVGAGSGTAWGSDLTEEYVVFNSAYTT